jgi:hypothetical protein
VDELIERKLKEFIQFNKINDEIELQLVSGKFTLVQQKFYLVAQGLLDGYKILSSQK